MAALSLQISDRAEPGLAVQAAVDQFVERAVAAPPDVIPSVPLDQLREATTLLAAVIPGARHACERAVTEEFQTRLALSLGDSARAGVILRHVREVLDQALPVIN
jgi:hypothetical protein